MIICPNFSNQLVLKEFNELKELVGEIGAYHIWNELNGNSIDMAPNGKPSKLFLDLLAHYEGDRQAAIKAKAKTFTETFKTWFGDSVFKDVNGEPSIYEYSSELVFVASSDASVINNLNTIDQTKVKSIDNTGSFNPEDTRTKGTELDETLQFYLSNSLDDQYRSDVEEFISAYRQYFDNYNYGSKENLDKALQSIVDNIRKTLKTRLYVLRKKDSSATDELKAAIELLIADLENKAIDRVTNIARFLFNTKQDIVSTVRQIRDVANGRSSKMPLKQLLELKQDFFDFYCPVLDDCVNTLTASSEYEELIGSYNYRDIMSQARTLQTLLNSGANSVQSWITQQAADEVRKIGISVNSPTIENYIHEHLNEVGKDILTITTWIGAGDKINDESVRALFHITQQAEFAIDRATLEKSNKLLSLLHKAGRFNQKKLVEVDDNGLPTGYLVRSRNYGKFNADFKSFLQKLRSDLNVLEDKDMRNVSPEIRREYNKRKNKWLSEHCERKYTPEYYELFNDLSPLASDARELIQIKIHKLLDTVKDSKGFYDTSKLSPENKKKLSDLYLEKKQLASVYDINGNLKTGEEYDIAVELAALNEKLSKGMVLKSNKALFDKVKAEKKATLSAAEYQKWLHDNSRDEYTQEFYDDLTKVEKSEIVNPADQKLYAELQDRKRAILRQFRSDKTHEIESLIPAKAQLELDKIDIDLSKIRKRSGKKKVPGLKFTDIAKVEPSQLYYKLRADAIASNTLAIFEMTHCNKDSFGNVYPKSYLTKIVPAKEKYILREQPSIYFSEVDKSSPFVNKNYNPTAEDEGEYYLPKMSLYDNTKAFKKVSENADLYALYKECVATMEESNSKLTNLTNLSAYRLPQISGSMWRYAKSRGFQGILEYWKDRASVKNDDTGLADSQKDNEDSEIELATESLRFVPQNYVKALDDPATITANTIGSIIQYFKMAENFRVKTELRPKAEAISKFIANRDVKSKIRGRSKKGVDSNLYKFVKNFIEMNIYDIKTKSVTVDIKERDLSVFGFNMHINPRKVNITKLMLGLKALGTTVNLGLNFICAVTGAFTAIYSDIVNSLTGRYYDIEDSFNGTKSLVVDLFKNNFSLLSDYNNSTQMHLMQLFQVGSELHTDRLNQSDIQKHIARNWAFGIYSVADYLVKGHILNSVMHNFRYVNGKFMNKEEFVKKYKNDDVMLRQWKNFRSSRDLVEYKNGSIVTKDPAHQKAWEERMETIGTTARNLAQSADGQLTPLQRTMLSSNILGSLVMMHRQFMPIIMQERWVQNRQWDYSSQRYKEAALRVPINIISAMHRDKRNLSLAQKFMQNSTWEQRKALLQLSIEWSGLAALHYFLLPIVKAWADDDKDDIIKQLLAFCLVRTDFESIMAMTPWAIQDAISTIKTPFPIYSYYDNFISFISLVPTFFYSLLSDEKLKKIDRGAYEGYDLSFKYGMKLTPFKNIWELQDIPSKRRYYEKQIANRD